MKLIFICHLLFIERTFNVMKHAQIKQFGLKCGLGHISHLNIIFHLTSESQFPNLENGMITNTILFS
jgi:hypothetical protein